MLLGGVWSSNGKAEWSRVQVSNGLCCGVKWSLAMVKLSIAM